MAFTVLHKLDSLLCNLIPFAPQHVPNVLATQDYVFFPKYTVLFHANLPLFPCSE